MQARCFQEPRVCPGSPRVTPAGTLPWLPAQTTGAGRGQGGMEFRGPAALCLLIAVRRRGGGGPSAPRATPPWPVALQCVLMSFLCWQDNGLAHVVPEVLPRLVGERHAGTGPLI